MKEFVFRILEQNIKIIHQKEKDNLALVGPIQLPVQLGTKTVVFQWYTWLSLKNLPSNKEELLNILPYTDLASSQQSSILIYGDFTNAAQSLMRFHSICHTGDIFGSKRCDCGFQLQQSLNMIVENGSGALFYLANHEGRGIGLFSKSLAYLLQEKGFDTVEANEQLGFEDDHRSYEEAIQILKTFRDKPVSLITNNPKKVASLRESGILVDQSVPLWGDVSRFNEKYLQTKIERSGHVKDLEKALL